MRVVATILLYFSVLLTAVPVFAAPAGLRGPAPGAAPARESQHLHGRRVGTAGERGQRLSVEERRALRRDIRDAGRQIYRIRR